MKLWDSQALNELGFEPEEKRPEILKAIRRRPLKFLRKFEGLRSDFALYGMPVNPVGVSSSC